MFEQMNWLNEPETWRHEGDRLWVCTDRNSDFWRETHYGFTRDSGHFLYRQSEGDFSAQVRVQGQFSKLYDQAGLMVRLDPQHWVKTGLEISDGAPMLSSVLTANQSDWATGLFPGEPTDFWMRVSVVLGVLRIQVSVDGEHWPLVRLAAFPVAASYQVGPFCCTPERGGLNVEFSEFQLGVPLLKALHELS